MRVERIDREKWDIIAEDAHLSCFSEFRPKGFNRFNYAIMAIDKDERPCAYATILELDQETAHMQHGGAFPNVRGTIISTKAYHHLIQYLRQNYKVATTYIKNTNISMLKLAMSAGFIAVGLDCHGEDMYLHFYNDLTEV